MSRPKVGDDVAGGVKEGGGARQIDRFFQILRTHLVVAGDEGVGDVPFSDVLNYIHEPIP